MHVWWVPPTIKAIKAPTWYYEFLPFFDMFYADSTYTFKNSSKFEPFVAAQYGDEQGSSGNHLVDTGTKLIGAAGNHLANRTRGADAGVAYASARCDVSYNRVEKQVGAVGEGAIISPYAAGYATDPLYTTSMIRGLLEQGPGHA